MIKNVWLTTDGWLFDDINFNQKFVVKICNNIVQCKNISYRILIIISMIIKLIHDMLWIEKKWFNWLNWFHGICTYLQSNQCRMPACFMITSYDRIIFRVTGPLWGESTDHRWIPHAKASDTGLIFFFNLRLNKRLSKQSSDCRWFETPSCSLWVTQYCLFVSHGPLNASKAFFM